VPLVSVAARSLVRVAVPAPVRRYFDYLAPAAEAGPEPAIGCRVRVPFGRSRQIVGVVVERPQASDVPATSLRPISEVIDTDPLLSAELVAMLRWAAQYYHHPPGEVFAAALPGTLKRGRQPPTADLSGWALTAQGRAQDPAQFDRRAPRQAEVLRLLAAQTGRTAAPVLEQALGRGWRPVIARLTAAGLVDSGPIDVLDAGATGGVPTETSAPVLTADQRNAVERIEADLGHFTAWLLHGVTGSGKTEVYLRIIRRVIDTGGQALVLVPEIGLTPQLVQRLADRLPTPVVTLHSGLPDAARARAFLDAREGRAGVVLGTRSGVFTSLRNLRLIVVDEEHDASLKQHEGFRYHARDLAVYRARQLGVPIVLGSATPSLESLHNVAHERYRLLRLPTRAGSGVPPSVRLVDMRRDGAVGGLTGTLVAAMRGHLAAGSQVLLFLNRRGYAPVWLCADCGWIAQCPRCDARLTFHQRADVLTCHHCGHERRSNDVCPDCGGTPRPIGEGTEQVEQALAEQFPDVPVARIDRDSTRRRGELERRLSGIRAGDTRILIGTQMLTKGHDFPGVTLVGVLNADGGLFGADFRAAERLAQLIVQVAGRAGRAASGGEVLVQTSFPQHPLLNTLLKDGYEGFARVAASEREASGWPPFSALALLRAEAPQAQTAQRFLDVARALASDELERTDGGDEVLLLGPAPAPMERRAGRYRAQLVLQASRRAPLQALLSALLPRLDAARESRRVRWSIDVDPGELD
jgi:primosomal protein N' (replication factor Y)